ncbi:hypothetical protein EDB85DRAFT_1890721 [Lactarius pseudohatsudake]|nr:hypothetical protein EDB85DRAFT_1890721 [Lactarius pseudohatsudake]
MEQKSLSASSCCTTLSCSAWAFHAAAGSGDWPTLLSFDNGLFRGEVLTPGWALMHVDDRSPWKVLLEAFEVRKKTAQMSPRVILQSFRKQNRRCQRRDLVAATRHSHKLLRMPVEKGFFA